MAISARSRLALIGVVPVAVLVALWVIAANRPTETPGDVVEVSGRMPLLEGDPVAGDERITPELYQGKVVLVNFWATWCGPCRREQPVLERVWREYRGRGVQFIGIDHTDGRAAARVFLDEFGVTYPSVYDPAGIWAWRFAIPYVPTTILIDRSGEMRYQLLGAQHAARLREHLDALLAEA